jgi:hypothetical protein
MRRIPGDERAKGEKRKGDEERRPVGTALRGSRASRIDH